MTVYDEIYSVENPRKEKDGMREFLTRIFI